jgi:hypothetical protein
MIRRPDARHAGRRPRRQHIWPTVLLSMLVGLALWALIVAFALWWFAAVLE